MGLLHESKADKWLEDDNLMLLMCWSRDGFTLQEIADKMGIVGNTLTRWKKDYPEIKKAIETGKEIPDYKVENALYNSALGYKTNEVKITKERNGMGQIVVTKVERIEKEVAPSTSAISLWLTNRRPDKYKRNRDNEDNSDGSDNNITVNIIRKEGNGSTKVSEEEDEDWIIETKKNSASKEGSNVKKNSGSNIEEDWDAVIAETEGWD